MNTIVLAQARIWLLVALLLLTGCGGSAATAPTPTNNADTRPSVVVTTTQLEDVVGVVAGERVRVIGLVPRNGDPHTFEPTPADVRQIAEAQAVFKNGAGLEGWIDELIANAGGQRPVFDVSQGLALGTIDRAFEEGGETDPHIWMSPVLMQAVVDRIAAGLSQIDPADTAGYTARAAAYQTELAELDRWAEQELSVIPSERRKLVTAHDAMGYFASRYQFTIIGAVIPSVSTEAADRSAQSLGALVETIKAAGVPTIFAEASNNPQFIEQVAAEAGVRVDALYVDSLGEPGSEAGTYLDFFRADVRKIVAGLR